MTIKVAIVEDDAEIREGLAVLINGSSGYRCVATFPDAEHAIAGLPSHAPDVVLMDIHLPKMSGIDCTEKLKTEHPNLQIMMLTVYEDDDQVFRSLAAGATGYVLKKTPPADLLEAIGSVFAGGSPMSDRIARKVVQEFHRVGRSSKEIENLTDRETEVLSYIAKGYPDKVIAEKLFISSETVRSHIRSVYQKLHVRSRTQAALKFLRH
jgi:DNA-binding NarL/FixJ family response regulator